MKAIAIAASIAAAAGVAHANIYQSDFESDDGGLLATGDWEYGSPVGFDGTIDGGAFGGPEPDGGNSGDFAWGTVIGGLHNPSLTSTLTLPGVDLSSATELRFFEYIDSGSNTFDMAKVFVGGNEVYLSDGLSSATWREVVLDLSGFSGTGDIVWEFTATGVVERVGWYIDDVTVVPSPGAAGLLGLGGIAAIRRRR